MNKIKIEKKTFKKIISATSIVFFEQIMFIIFSINDLFAQIQFICSL